MQELPGYISTYSVDLDSNDDFVAWCGRKLRWQTCNMNMEVRESSWKFTTSFPDRTWSQSYPFHASLILRKFSELFLRYFRFHWCSHVPSIWDPETCCGQCPSIIQTKPSICGLDNTVQAQANTSGGLVPSTQVVGEHIWCVFNSIWKVVYIIYAIGIISHRWPCIL